MLFMFSFIGSLLSTDFVAVAKSEPLVGGGGALRDALGTSSRVILFNSDKPKSDLGELGFDFL